MRDGPTMSDSQIALWVESLNPKPKHHTVPGPAMVLRGARKKHPQPPEKPVGSCVHRMRISEPNGAVCHGVCLYCGFERDYQTVSEDCNTSLTVRESKVGRWW